MIVGINCGHTKSGAGYGAVGIIKESEHTRLVGQALMDLLRSAGVGVVDCTIDSAYTQNEYLAAEQLNALLLTSNPQATNYLHLAEIFLEEGEKEGVRGDGAFCQSLVETGYFKFGGDVKPEQHNYAGLGATGGVPGLSFPDDRTGIRAQIQHLKAYASTVPLVQECVDPRYKYVSKECAPTFEQLSGKWAVPGYSGYASLEAARAAKDSYGDHIAQLLGKAIGTKVPAQSEPEHPSETIPEGMLYVVQAGAYQSLGSARKLQQRLEEMGIASLINEYRVGSLG